MSELRHAECKIQTRFQARYEEIKYLINISMLTLCWNDNILYVVDVQSPSRVRLSVIPWTVICQAPLSTGFSRQEHWGGLPCPPPGDLSNPGIKPASFTSLALAGRFFTTSATTKRGPQSQKSEVICPRSQSYSIIAFLNLSSPLFKVF